MANYWAITIGINQYRHLQPLMHAQNDALFTHRFFTDNAGVPADNCVLLSDLATSVGHQVVYPDKPAIAQWVQTITQQVGPDDVLWFFFSGYGTQIDGKDYLMPIDGDPGQIKDTAIPISEVIETLAQLPTDKVLLILDINRSQGALAGQTIGTEVIELAQSSQVPTLLSCQPEQYSHETLGVRHGLFTAALLESLQQDCTTPSQIQDYLTKRLPELCEHHWRPIQNPVGLIPDAAKLAVVVPSLRKSEALNAAFSGSATDTVAETTAATTTDSSQSDQALDQASDQGFLIEPPQSEVAAAAGVTAGAAGIAAGMTSQDSPLTIEPPSQLPSSQLPSSQFPYTEETNATGTYRADKNNAKVIGGNSSDSPNGRGGALATLNEEDSGAIVPYRQDAAAGNGAKLRNWGLLALALLMVGVLLKQPFVKTAWKGFGDKIETAKAPADGESADGSGTVASGGTGDTTGDVPVPDSEGTAPGAVTPEGAAPADVNPDSTPDDGSKAPDAEATDASEEKTGEDADADTDASADGAENGATEAATNASSNADSEAKPAEVATPEDKAKAKELIDKAKAAIDEREYSEALIALQQVPNSQRDSTFSSVLTRARAGNAEIKQTNASVLIEARTSIQPTQASQFSEAIAKARQIKKGEPSYEDAQEDIRNWSRIILDISEGRATGGNLAGAIAAARVMPPDNSEAYKKAQDRITFWQQRQNSRTIITDAQKIPKTGQASTYQKGIVKLREVPIEHPEYETAQRLADEWSQRIFSIAQARAAQDRKSAAIQAAILVPAGTTAYEPTQQAIRRWQTDD